MGIRVNAIAPGMIESPGVHGSQSDEEIAEKVKAIPLGRIGQPRDIGDAAVFLASDAAGYTLRGHSAGQWWPIAIMMTDCDSVRIIH